MRTRVPLSLLIIFLTLGAAPPKSLPEAETSFLEAYDAQEDARDLKAPMVALADRSALKWLVESATKAIPTNPFRRGSAPWREAESLRHLSALPTDSWLKAIESQPLTLRGSRLGLWRWGQSRVRDGRMGAGLRRQWEDKLLASGTSDLLFEYALRHALCFALAEADEVRFAQLKERWSAPAPDIFLDFQRAFALLGSPSPLFTLWKLPDMTTGDFSLHALGTHRIWIAADSGKGLPELPADAIWIMPTKQGLQPEGQNTLLEPELSEARSLAARLQEAKREAYLAPVRKPFETYALMYFPILIELDAEGSIRKIRMGDAALAKEK